MRAPEETIALQILLIGMIVFFVLALSVILFFIVYQRRLFRQQKKHQLIESAYQKELLNTFILAQEEERNRIAKELHDDIGAMLTIVKLYFDQATKEIPDTEFDIVKEKATNFLDETIQSVRRISQDLRPVVLEKLGLIEAMQSLAQTMTESGKIEVLFESRFHTILSKSEEHNIYRIIQELIVNTLKHAEATIITITMDYISGYLELRYTDNGKGFTQENLKFKKGLGLKNIESRLSVLSGKMIIEKPIQGIEVKLQIPIDTNK